MHNYDIYKADFWQFCGFLLLQSLHMLLLAVHVYLPLLLPLLWCASYVPDACEIFSLTFFYKINTHFYVDYTPTLGVGKSILLIVQVQGNLNVQLWFSFVSV